MSRFQVRKVAVLGAIGVSASTVGAGFIVGARIAIPALVVALIGLAVKPYLISIGWLGANDPYRKIGFIISLGTILGAAALDITLILIEAAKRFKNQQAPTAADPDWKRVNMIRLLLWIGALGVVPLSGLWLVPETMPGLFWYLLATQVVSGVLWSAWELAQLLLMFETIPEAERTSLWARFNVGNSFAQGLGTMAGAWLLVRLGADHQAYATLFLLSIALRLATSGGLYAWELKQGAQEVQARVSGQTVFNGAYQMLHAAVAGAGLAFLPEDMVAEHLAAGRLVSVMQNWCPAFPGLHAYYPSRRQSSRALGLVIEAIRMRR